MPGTRSSLVLSCFECSCRQSSIPPRLSLIIIPSLLSIPWISFSSRLSYLHTSKYHHFFPFSGQASFPICHTITSSASAFLSLGQAFWASRGHRYRPLTPPRYYTWLFIFITQRSFFSLLVELHRIDVLPRCPSEGYAIFLFLVWLVFWCVIIRCAWHFPCFPLPMHDYCGFSFVSWCVTMKVACIYGGVQS